MALAAVLYMTYAGRFAGGRVFHGWGPVAVAVGMVPVLLLPWSLQRFMTEGVAPWYAEAGLSATDLVADLGFWELLGGRAATADLGAAPVWLSIGIAVAAVLDAMRDSFAGAGGTAHGFIARPDPYGTQPRDIGTLREALHAR